MVYQASATRKIKTQLSERAVVLPLATAAEAVKSATALTADALRTTLEAIVMQAALDDHYERFPDARPDLGDLAVAAAELDGHPLAAEPGRIRQAAAEIATRHPGASPEDVLVWAEARAWDRSSPACAFANSLRIADVALDTGCANAAAAIRNRTQVSVADAHMGAAIRILSASQVTVVTSDPRDMRLVAGDKDITIVTI
jgi:hypothetical protein